MQWWNIFFCIFGQPLANTLRICMFDFVWFLPYWVISKKQTRVKFFSYLWIIPHQYTCLALFGCFLISHIFGKIMDQWPSHAQMIPIHIMSCHQSHHQIVLKKCFQMIPISYVTWPCHTMSHHISHTIRFYSKNASQWYPYHMSHDPDMTLSHNPVTPYQSHHVTYHVLGYDISLHSHHSGLPNKTIFPFLEFLPFIAVASFIHVQTIQNYQKRKCQTPDFGLSHFFMSN
jgi:hypothetical protein